MCACVKLCALMWVFYDRETRNTFDLRNNFKHKMSTAKITGELFMMTNAKEQNEIISAFTLLHAQSALFGSDRVSGEDGTPRARSPYPTCPLLLSALVSVRKMHSWR